ncbi:MAG: DUF302 domain-containing protein [Bacteroidetes bacterium]|nr:DUF302 domain-containing protein [Bacteroidota bacterium]
MKYGLSKIIPFPYDKAVEKATEELKKEGFGVLTTIDVKATLKEKIGVDFKKYVILGACNPPLAHKALTAEETEGLLLPCNVVVYENDNKETVVGVFDPLMIGQVSDNKELHAIADEVRSKLERVFDAL